MRSMFKTSRASHGVNRYASLDRLADAKSKPTGPLKRGQVFEAEQALLRSWQMAEIEALRAEIAARLAALPTSPATKAERKARRAPAEPTKGFERGIMPGRAEPPPLFVPPSDDAA